MKQALKIKVSQYSSMSQKSLDFQPKFNTKVECFNKELEIAEIWISHYACKVETDSPWKAKTCHSRYIMVSMCPFMSLLSPPSLKHLQLWASQIFFETLARIKYVFSPWHPRDIREINKKQLWHVFHTGFTGIGPALSSTSHGPYHITMIDLDQKPFIHEVNLPTIF